MWETIKQILSKNSGTCIIIEEGKPAYVVTRFDEYQKLLDNPPMPRLRDSMDEQGLLEKINQEINNWKTRQAEESPELSEAEIPEDEDDLKIENLPIV